MSSKAAPDTILPIVQWRCRLQSPRSLAFMSCMFCSSLYLHQMLPNTACNCLLHMNLPIVQLLCMYMHFYLFVSISCFDFLSVIFFFIYVYIHTHNTYAYLFIYIYIYIYIYISLYICTLYIFIICLYMYIIFSHIHVTFSFRTPPSLGLKHRCRHKICIQTYIAGSLFRCIKSVLGANCF